MPRQYALLGFVLPRLSIRRLTCLLFGFSLIAIIFISTTTSSVTTSIPSLASGSTAKITDIQIPASLSESRLNPFRQPSHPPPRQKDDSFRGSSWWSDWKWSKSPFSNSYTLDNDRALLPPLPPRTPIYCYYDASGKRPRQEKDAESDILLTWRRAWWAAGFEPIILSSAEATKNPMYQQLQGVEMPDAVRADLMRWLAWGSMDGGILTKYTLMPIFDRYQHLVPFLRRGEYPTLTRWESLGSSLYAGQGPDVQNAISDVLKANRLGLAETLAQAMPDSLFEVDRTPAPLAYYDADVVRAKYPAVDKKASESFAKGLRSLNQLINAHLHNTFQNHFAAGVEVIQPHVDHLAPVVEEAMNMAKALATCPDSPSPSSCPPNKPKCTPCNSAKPIPVRTTANYHNSSKIFTIGTVPHPWTFQVLNNMRDDFNVSWIRRSTPRDEWLSIVTDEALNKGLSTNRRITAFKESVAAEEAAYHTLWYTAEVGLPRQIEWQLGFLLPGDATLHKDNPQFEKSLKDSKKHARAEQDDEDATQSTEAEGAEEDHVDILAEEVALFDKAKDCLFQKKSTDKTKIRASLEAWNMADLEVWKFVKAFQARKYMVWSRWEEQERKYSQGSGSQQGRTTLSRWRDEEDADST